MEKVMENQSWRYMNLLLESLFWNLLFQIWAGSCTDSILVVNQGVITEELWPRQEREGGFGWYIGSLHNKASWNGWLNNRNLLSHSSGSQKPKIKVTERLCSKSVWLADKWLALFSLCLLYVWMLWPGLCPFSTFMGFPGGASGKESAHQCKRCRRCVFYPWMGKIPWRRAWQPTPVFLPGEFSLDRGAWQATVHGVANESQRTEWLSTTHIVRGPNSSVTIIEEMRPLRVKF